MPRFAQIKHDLVSKARKSFSLCGASGLDPLINSGFLEKKKERKKYSLQGLAIALDPEQ